MQICETSRRNLADFQSYHLVYVDDESDNGLDSPDVAGYTHVIDNL